MNGCSVECQIPAAASALLTAIASNVDASAILFTPPLPPPLKVLSPLPKLSNDPSPNNIISPPADASAPIKSTKTFKPSGPWLCIPSVPSFIADIGVGVAGSGSVVVMMAGVVVDVAVVAVVAVAVGMIVAVVGGGMTSTFASPPSVGVGSTPALVTVSAPLSPCTLPSSPGNDHTTPFRFLLLLLSFVSLSRGPEDVVETFPTLTILALLLLWVAREIGLFPLFPSTDPDPPPAATSPAAVGNVKTDDFFRMDFMMGGGPVGVVLLSITPRASTDPSRPTLALPLIMVLVLMLVSMVVIFASVVVVVVVTCCSPGRLVLLLAIKEEAEIEEDSSDMAVVAVVDVTVASVAVRVEVVVVVAVGIIVLLLLLLLLLS